MTVDEVRRRLRHARAGISADASIKLVQPPKSVPPHGVTPASVNREQAPRAPAMACDQCRQRGPESESRHRAD